LTVYIVRGVDDDKEEAKINWHWRSSLVFDCVEWGMSERSEGMGCNPPESGEEVQMLRYERLRGLKRRVWRRGRGRTTERAMWSEVSRRLNEMGE